MSDAQAQDAGPRCHFCRRAVAEGQWFARLWRRGVALMFCRPACVERFCEAELADESGEGASHFPASFH